MFNPNGPNTSDSQLLDFPVPLADG